MDSNEIRDRSDGDLQSESRRYQGTGGVSQCNQGLGFRPAFRDAQTGRIYRSRFANGRPAPVHLVEGLPAGVLARLSLGGGRSASARTGVIAGFVRGRRFYTRAEAAQVVELGACRQTQHY